MTAAPMPRLTPADRAVHAAVEPVADDDDDALSVEPQDTQPPPAARPVGLGGDNLSRLRAVLQDLTECRRLIDAAVARPE
jgi:hypothetical protein